MDLLQLGERQILKFAAALDAELDGLANGFGLSTIAECVESADEAALLRSEGIGYLQGYHFGRPSLERAWLTAARADGLRAPAAP